MWFWWLLVGSCAAIDWSRERPGELASAYCACIRKLLYTHSSSTVGVLADVTSTVQIVVTALLSPVGPLRKPKSQYSMSTLLSVKLSAGTVIEIVAGLTIVPSMLFGTLKLDMLIGSTLENAMPELGPMK